MSDHPFLQNSPLPKWSSFAPECIRDDITLALSKAEDNLQTIRDLNLSEVNFENTVKALESSTRELDEAWGLIAHLDSVCNSEELRNAHNEMLPAISEFSAKIPLDAKLWEAIKCFAETDEAKKLPQIDQRLLSETIKDFQEAGADLAGIILTAFRHDVRRDQELPKKAFLKKAREICDKKNAVLILDDVRAGFRINRRGSWVDYGVKPDLTAFSKAIGNGYPLSAVVGVEKLRQAASEIYVTGSFWCNATSMAASLKTLSIIEERDVVEHISSLGEKLRSGVGQIANSVGVEISQSGPVQMPLILFKDDKDFLKGSKFVQYLLSKGIYFHPWHNMFLSLAHTAEDVSTTLDAVEFAMKKISEEF